eukprot:TRINITY_DN2696_c3_g1_i1.p1 TRINITY_DN2696_c3_g1~~TRINITY_DN2696_c3_g1_i1.p1  ORF type:complete len:411 (+),score=30.32 TRINITY_DN2696_c3_g1_i1:109-1341(+)
MSEGVPPETTVAEVEPRGEVHDAGHDESKKYDYGVAVEGEAPPPPPPQQPQPPVPEQEGHAPVPSPPAQPSPAYDLSHYHQYQQYYNSQYGQYTAAQQQAGEPGAVRPPPPAQQPPQQQPPQQTAQMDPAAYAAQYEQYMAAWASYYQSSDPAGAGVYAGSAAARPYAGESLYAGATVKRKLGGGGGGGPSAASLADRQPGEGNPNAAPCKFFERGECKFGNRCHNLHQGSGGSKEITACRDYVTSRCPAGCTCKMLHYDAATGRSEYTIANIDRISASIAANECRFYIEGTCRFQERCSLTHNSEKAMEYQQAKAALKTVPCQAFRIGKCKFTDDQCVFEHRIGQESPALISANSTPSFVGGGRKAGGAPSAHPAIQAAPQYSSTAPYSMDQQPELSNREAYPRVTSNV